jgi:hypothetical protein
MMMSPIASSPALSMLSILPARANAGAFAGQCTAAEQTYFACQTSKQQFISACGTLPGQLQYRFGTKQAVQLPYPADATESHDERAVVRPPNAKRKITCTKPINCHLIKLKEVLKRDADNALNGRSCP